MNYKNWSVLCLENNCRRDLGDTAQVPAWPPVAFWVQGFAQSWKNPFSAKRRRYFELGKKQCSVFAHFPPRRRRQARRRVPGVRVLGEACQPHLLMNFGGLWQGVETFFPFPFPANMWFGWVKQDLAWPKTYRQDLILVVHVGLCNFC